MSAKTSDVGRRLVLTYEKDLWSRLPRSQRGVRVFEYQRRALALFVAWLRARGVELHQAWPEDLLEYRGAIRGTARTRLRRFEAVRRIYRFLYCNQHLRHDPSAVVDLPPRAKALKNPRRQSER